MRFSEFSDMDYLDDLGIDDYIKKSIDENLTKEKLRGQTNQKNIKNLKNKSELKRHSATNKFNHTKKSTSQRNSNSGQCNQLANHSNQKKIKIPVPIPYTPQKPNAHYKASVFKRKLRTLDKLLPPLYPPQNILDI
jgi:response regulator RpfG family c-di-GMP phosphodiesterase